MPPLAALMMLVATGCVSLPRPPAPTTLETAPAAGLRADAPASEGLRPGDTVAAQLETAPPREHPQLLVSATGELHVPGLGDFQVAGLGLAEAERLVQTRLRRDDAQAVATLQWVSRAGRQVTVLGAVARQGAVPVAPGMRVADAIAAAGGLLATPPIGAGVAPVPLADAEQAVLRRAGAPLPVSVSRALRGEAGHNVLVHPGDLIHVPLREQHSVSVLGQVGGPTVLPHWDGMRLTEALALAGGVTADGDKSDIRIVRGPPDAPVAYSADLAAIVSGDGPDTTLQPGDVLFVTDEWLEDVREVLGALAPVVSLASTALLLGIVTSR